MFFAHFAACFSWGALAVFLGMEMTTTHVLGSLQKTSKDSCTPIKVKCRIKTHDTISCSPRQTHSNQIIVIDNYIRVAMASHLRCVKRRKLSAKHRRHCSFYNGRPEHHGFGLAHSSQERPRCKCFSSRNDQVN